MLRSYFETRILHGALPLLRDPATWDHPLLASVADANLREDLLALASRTPTLLARVEGVPAMFAHGDACPQNLLVAAGLEGFVAVDWGLAGARPVGHDLSQLLAGHAEAGLLEGHELPPIDRRIVAEYLGGVHSVGASATESDVREGYVASLVVRSAFTCVSAEDLSKTPTAGGTGLLRRRLAFARFIIDLARTTFPR